MATGCIRAYRPPRAGEPAALLKVRLAYDHGAALSHLPSGSHSRAMVAQVFVVEADGEPFLLTGRTWPDQLERTEPAPIDTLAASIHPDRNVLLEVRLGVSWQTTQLETVTESKQVPTQVTRTEYQYDPVSRSSRAQAVTRTEYKTEHKQVTRSVTRTHGTGCSARARLEPAKDAVYLVDYTNMLISSGCSATVFRQLPQPDGTFSLQRIASVPPG